MLKQSGIRVAAATVLTMVMAFAITLHFDICSGADYGPFITAAGMRFPGLYKISEKNLVRHKTPPV